jgi:hypothetical protein
MVRVVETVPILVGLPQEAWDFSDSDQPMGHVGEVVASYNGLLGSVMEGAPVRCLAQRAVFE